MCPRSLPRRRTIADKIVPQASTSKSRTATPHIGGQSSRPPLSHGEEENPERRRRRHPASDGTARPALSAAAFACGAASTGASELVRDRALGSLILCLRRGALGRFALGELRHDNALVVSLRTRLRLYTRLSPRLRTRSWQPQQQSS